MPCVLLTRTCLLEPGHPSSATPLIQPGQSLEPLKNIHENLVRMSFKHAYTIWIEHEDIGTLEISHLSL